MLARDVNARYASADELLADLHECLRSMPVLTTRWREKPKSKSSLGERFTLEDPVSSQNGRAWKAKDRETGEQVKVTLLHSSLQPQALLHAGEAVNRMATAETFGLLRPLHFGEFTEGIVLVEEITNGIPLESAISRGGAKPLAQSATLIWQLGAALEEPAAAHLSGFNLSQAQVEWLESGQKNAPDWSAATLKISLAPWMSGQSSGSDDDAYGTATQDPQLNLTGTQLLARWMYFIIGGRRPAQSALTARKEYIAIPQISAQSNHLLAGYLCGESQGNVRKFVQDLFASENVSWTQTGDKVRRTRDAALIRQLVPQFHILMSETGALRRGDFQDRGPLPEADAGRGRGSEKMLPGGPGRV
jgi:hypothetical protein